MKKFKIHNIRKENKMHWYEKLNQYFYGESYQPVDEVLTFNLESKMRVHLKIYNFIKQGCSKYCLTFTKSHLSKVLKNSILFENLYIKLHLNFKYIINTKKCSKI